jgi:rhodanese-related sulfurtransferase
MTPPTITPSQVRTALLLREEIALLDLRHEAAFATGHPLFAANMASGRIALEAGTRLPRKDAGYELFQDVNSYAKAFGELVESRRHTPSLAAEEVASLIADKANIRILDVRRFDEYATMNIPGSISVPGGELVLRAAEAAPDPDTTIIVNCAGRTRSIIGTQSLINAGVTNKVVALRNGTIGWTLAKQISNTALPDAARSVPTRAPRPMPATSPIAPASAASAWRSWPRSGRRPAERSIASTCATPRNMPPVTSKAFVIMPAASWSRRSTWPHRYAARALSCRTISASAPT